jgi:uncharacterized protein (TIRG00374 family)
MNSSIKKIASYSILVLILILFVNYLYHHTTEFKETSLTNPLWIIPLIIIFLLNYIFVGIQTKAILEPFGIKLKTMELYMLSIVTGFYNIITPARGGTGIKAVYLKKKHNFAYTKFLATLTGTYILIFFISSLFGLISLLFIYKFYNVFNSTILLLFLGIFISSTLIILFSPNFKEARYGWLNHFIKVANNWNIIRRNKGVLFTYAVVTILSLLISITNTIISYYIFGIHISFIQALFLTCIGSISVLIQITPGNLGVGEAIAVFSALIIGITPAQSLPVAIFGRIVQMIVLFTLGPIFSYILFKHKPKKEEDEKHT